ncbi:inosine/xanthosine triphosphatase [Vibrio sp. Of7-15]|uniref:inosine/xanthosine triphosphatase n=1 Tax=Vibrio sp. Of7-15 TaxID=2724879 RepID=UPI001EF3AEA2|nr:inosine/xanthosine triphosphatase [Vibrio sp. Of7-15]MCG7499853.1 inosine/xanthosine triphosphatase [Vibrio sp. Of7-15]
MKTVIVGSMNPAKIKAVQDAFTQCFPDTAFHFQGSHAKSLVADQPLSCEETLAGARNRVKDTKIQYPNADYFVGLEAGIEEGFTFAWMVIEDKQQRGESRSSSLMLPPEALTEIAKGHELGDVMDNMFNTQNIKQKGGAIGLLTNNLLSRSSVYHQALILALIPFMNPEHFS